MTRPATRGVKSGPSPGGQKWAVVDMRHNPRLLHHQEPQEALRINASSFMNGPAADDVMSLGRRWVMASRRECSLTIVGLIGIKPTVPVVAWL